MLMTQTFRYRTIWISDVHLGTKGCQAELLLDFLKHTESETLYLVGDIIDGWRLKNSWYWPQAHNDVAQKLLRKARKGTKVIYVPGNHDEFARPFVDHHFGGIEVRKDTFHDTADGRRLLIIHGDELDAVVKSVKWLAYVGDWAYRVALFVNVYYNVARKKMGYGYWSLSAYLKYKVKNAVAHIGKFEESVAALAQERGADGVVCGHIHHPEMREVGGILYVNDGDWVESCTALVEHHDGRLELLRWMAPLADRRARGLEIEQLEIERVEAGATVLRV
ncbi:MAG TPA: UDP-2,3-diacylglucosamine diphosphatase [Alphaproteobacteria bacterium]|nr:UDP-2,3-diacylglucosamine diphosphatase [Alphaproteobacteria bacterium]